MLNNRTVKAVKGPSLVKEYVKLGEKFRESSENLANLNETLNKNLTFQKMCTNLFQYLINLHIDITATSRYVLSRIVNTLSMECGAIHILAEDKKGLRLTASHSIPKEFFENVKNMFMSDSVIGRTVAKSHDPIVLNSRNLDLQKNGNDRLNEEKIVVFVPMRVNDELIGILTLFVPGEQHFSEDDRQMFAMLSDYLSIGFKNNMVFEETKKKATKDNLTDLHNRVYFHEFLSLELNRSERYNKPLSLAIMDIDYFKKINDTFGHHAGDLILKEFADILKTSFRKTDLVARYGGEEFVVVFPEANTNNTIRVVSKLQKRLNEHFFKSNGKKHKITISMGISAFTPDEGISQHELILRADKALYNAKESGRNMVKVWNV